MDDFFNVKTVQEALKITLDALVEHGKVRLESETVPSLSSAGRWLAQDIKAVKNVPPFTRSTVDGYAVRARDTFGATESLPAILEVIEEIPMGKPPKKALGPGQASKIATGGALPEGADAALMIEYVDYLDDRTILAKKPVAPGENVIEEGEDFPRGKTILKRGTVLRPFEIGALASVGVVDVPVFKKPRIGLLSTGDEIVPPTVEPSPGQIPDINTYSLGSYIESIGAVPVLLGISRDNYMDTRSGVEKGLSVADIVVISGGSSVGARDVVVKVISDLGPPGVLVHGVAIKPGKPVIIGMCQGKLVFGLPGHPVSALTSFRLFVKIAVTYLLKASAGTLDSYSPWDNGQDNFWKENRENEVTARLSRNISSATGREDHVRVKLRRENGELWADPVLGKSGLISTMVNSDGEIVIPFESEGLRKDTMVKVYVF